jgi:hypothetical protein
MKGRVEKAEAKDRVAKTTSAYRDTIVNFYFVGSSRLFLILKLFCPFLGAYAYLCLDKDEVYISETLREKQLKMTGADDATFSRTYRKPTGTHSDYLSSLLLRPSL